VSKTLEFEEFDFGILARTATKDIYNETNKPKWIRDFGFRDQIRRAAVSVISNIAEGSRRESNKDFSHFLSIAKGSAAEVRAQLYVALDLEYIDEATFNRISGNMKLIDRKIGGFQKYLLSTQVPTTKAKREPTTNDQ